MKQISSLIIKREGARAHRQPGLCRRRYPDARRRAAWSDC